VIGDCEQVFGELPFWVGIMVFTFTENHELDASFFKDPFHEFVGKSAQAVFLKFRIKKK